MKFETKFSCGDEVVPVSSFRRKIFIPCGFCGTSGRITGANEKSILCPECRGKGVNEGWEEKATWNVGEPLTVGQVRVAYTQNTHRIVEESTWSNYGPQDEKYEERYMCRETGIGTGTLHKHHELFRTVKEAQEECDKRNSK